MRIVLDENKCSSLGMCESVAPDFFEVRDDGALELLNPTPSGDQRELMEEVGPSPGARRPASSGTRACT